MLSCERFFVLRVGEHFFVSIKINLHNHQQLRQLRELFKLHDFFSTNMRRCVKQDFFQLAKIGSNFRVVAGGEFYRDVSSGF